MSLLFLLSDGTFLIYDGGHGHADAHHLFGTMKRLAKQYALEKITVSAWIITHYHRDHCGFLEPFLAAYKERVEIREFWYHSIGRGDADRILREHCPETPIRRLSMGERVRLADAEIEVLCTPEALVAFAPDAMNEDDNNASLVTRLHVGGKSLLISADAARAAWEFLACTHGKNLKSDVFQVPHHGVPNGGSVEAYRLVDADTLLFTCGEKMLHAATHEGEPYVSLLYTHDLFCRSTHELLKDFRGEIVLAGLFDGCNPRAVRIV
jgi:beta-lactamase superfamily II metal-dependent hydrolase